MVIIQSAIEIIEKYENNCQNPNSTSTVVVFDVKKMHSNNNKTTTTTTKTVARSVNEHLLATTEHNINNDENHNNINTSIGIDMISIMVMARSRQDKNPYQNKDAL